MARGNRSGLLLANVRLGSILVAATDRGVCAISLGDEPEALIQDLQDRFPRAQLIGADKEFEQTGCHCHRSCRGSGMGLDLPLDVRGTAFQQRVWQALRFDPSGIHGELQRNFRTDRSAESGSRGSTGMRLQSSGSGNSLSPRGTHGRHSVWLPLGSRSENRAAESGRRIMTGVLPRR